VQISNKKGEFISKLPGTASISKKLLVELQVVWHGMLLYRTHFRSIFECRTI